MNLKNKLAIATSALVYGLPAVALAQMPEEVPDFDPEAFQEATRELEEATGAAARTGLFATGFLGALAGFAIVLTIIGLVFLILWIWALIDVLTRTFPGNLKQTWTWLIVLSFAAPLVLSFIPFLNFLNIVLGPAGVVIVIVYLVSIRKKGTKGGGQAPPAAPAQPTK